MKLIASVISAVITLTASLAGIIVLMLVAHVTIDVVMRFAFDTPLNSTILYVSAFYMVAIAFLPLAAVEQNDSHIAVELLVERFPTKVQSFLAGLALLLTCIGDPHRRRGFGEIYRRLLFDRGRRQGDHMAHLSGAALGLWPDVDRRRMEIHMSPYRPPARVERLAG